MSQTESLTSNERVPTHRCKVCGCKWILWPPGSHGVADSWWSLGTNEKCGPCCDNVAMGDQIETLAEAFERIRNEADAERLLRKGLSTLLEAQDSQEATGPRWIPVSERLPESGVPVLAHITNSHGKTRRLRAQWIAKHTDELWDGDDMAGDYSEETDTTYTPEGWYETNEYEETHFHINDPVSHWMPLPPGPDQASTPVEPKPSEATGLQCEKDGVCALVSRNDDEWHCTACNGDFVRKQPVEPGGWRPIKTAPKKGRFMVWIPATDLAWPAYAGGDWIYSNAHGALNEMQDGRVLTATHWMPLPSAPSTKSGEQT